MTVQNYAHGSRSSRPFGEGLRDPDLRLLVASIDVRYRQKVQAVIVRRSNRLVSNGSWFDVELIVLNTPENVLELRREAHSLDPDGRLQDLVADDIADVILTSKTTGERLMVTSVGVHDFERVEQIGSLEQIHIGGKGDRGSWVCRTIDAERLNALFSGRLIDIRSDAAS